MALGKYSRVDGKKSTSSYCSTVSLVVFVALCLVGVWMLTSSSVVPVQNVDVSTQEANDEVKERGSEISENNKNNENNETNPKPFEDNPGDLPDEATKGNNNDNSSQQGNTSTENPPDNTENANENAVEKNQEDKPEKENSQEENKSEDASKTNKENGDVDKTESNDSGAGDTKTDGNDEKKQDSEDGQNEKKPEDNSGETKDDEKKPEDNSGETKDDVKDENQEKEKSDSDQNEKKPEDNSGETKDGVRDENQEKEKADSDQNEKKPEDNSRETKDGVKDENQEKEKSDSDQNEKKPEDNSGETKDVVKDENQGKEKPFEAELLNETNTQNGDWKTQASESKNEHETAAATYNWKLCNVTAGPDYIPCLDNWQAIKNLPSTKHYEHRERHCPEDPPTCLVSLPEGYQRSIDWPTSREKIWYHNVPHTKLAEVKGHQNWVKVSGEYLIFPGGGTQFKNGALHYIDVIQQAVPDIAWGKQSRVVLDVGCGVASFGGFLFDRGVLTMSFAPKDEHEAQIQFALERGIPGISAVMGTKRLPFPGRVFDVVHCARCRVPWHIEGGKLLLELNRVLRPGGFFVWSATPVYQKGQEDVEIWIEMTRLTKAMCWEMVAKTKKDKVNMVGIAIYRKPTTNECYEKRSKSQPPVCQESDDINAAWNVPLQACMHQIPVDTTARGSQWPEQWSDRLTKPPYWLLSSNKGVYGKPAPEDFSADYQHWKRVVTNSYLKGMGINWSTVRNVMDMKAIYGGFAAALKDLNVWVMNVVPLDSPDTLPVIYERGLFGIYHDWCESFNTYPRSYDLIHADHLFSKTSKKCNILGVVAETDRILRPEGMVIVRDKVETINELEGLFKAMHWEVRLTYSKDGEGLLLVKKTMWRPTESETITYAIA